jgi:YD repeat-containing protein
VQHGHTYDPTNRLSSATLDSLTTSWTYDANGNRTGENGTTIATYDSQDCLQTWKANSYQYTAAGDLARRTGPAGTAQYSYDAQPEAVRVDRER